ncbi:MAG: aminoacyl-tRNA hydrolase [Candidatus Berkelbacteria bacterium]
MKLIVGLGNPGKQYEGTRHNAGFMFLDKLVGHAAFTVSGDSIQFSKEDKFDSLVAQTVLSGEKFIFAKPQTFMNLSGNAVAEIMQYYKISPEDLIVVSDDADLPIGTSRIRTDGSSGGQKGLQSIIEALNLYTFVRVRIGIKALAANQDEAENISQISLSDFVLSKFDKREEKILEASMDETIRYLVQFLGSNQEIVPHTIEAKINT